MFDFNENKMENVAKEERPEHIKAARSFLFLTHKPIKWTFGDAMKSEREGWGKGNCPNDIIVDKFLVLY